MAKLESDFLSSCPIRPLAYYRFIDDILIIWTESEQQLKTFHEQFNQFHPTINLTLNYSSTEINFLDTIIKLKNNEIETSLYQKPIDHPTYLKWDSFHPKHIKNSIIYSQAIRYNRICSNRMDRDKHLGRLKKTFLNQGYHPRTIENQITRATRLSRNHLLHYKAKEENNRVPLVVTYNPNLEVLRGAARKLQPLLQKDARLKSIFPDPPLLCFRQPPNLRSIIVRSSLSSPTAAGTFPCNQKKCKTCPFIMTTDKIKIPNSHQDYTIPGTFTCITSNVVYLIICTKCPTGGLYVGETGQKLRTRMNAHRHTIREKRMDLPVAKHFCIPDHSSMDMKLLVLKGNFTSQRERRVWEYKFMTNFDTLSAGMNVSHGFMSFYIN
ncbi:uncharacterized protein [Dendrobates tinctorius]|uniref:uncharacterized protein n=1 Tax=Dendrobates tinctorius TaxID=92724 RepID=UPI003CC9E63E